MTTSLDSETKEFEKRKQDHIRLSLATENQALGGNGFDRVELIHEALPECDFSEVTLTTSALKQSTFVPFFISSMTAGHEKGHVLNRRLAQACESRGWWMGVGSQRRQLFDKEAEREWLELRAMVPGVKLLGNLGLTQAIQSEVSEVQALVDSLQAIAMIIHTNPLQEALQPEGTPQFKGGIRALEKLCSSLSVPIILKETGCGFSSNTFRKLEFTGVAAVDVSGFGGTHWGRIEGARASKEDVRHMAAESFADWGISTVDSLIAAREVKPKFEIWASGGIRNGVEALMAFALGAKLVGFAKPALEAALIGESALKKWMETKEYELRTAMFCTGVKSLSTLEEKQVWQWRKT